MSDVSTPRRRVLFLCSGNYYRSRYAEALFNHHARAVGAPWRAFSRGLSIHLIRGALSPHTRKTLLHRGISLGQTAHARCPLNRADLASAAHIVALKQAEHQPIMRARFPEDAARVEYWRVHDLDASSTAETMAHIEKLVAQLARRLFKTPLAVPTRGSASRPRASGKAGRPSRRANAAA